MSVKASQPVIEKETNPIKDGKKSAPPKKAKTPLLEVKVEEKKK